MVLKTDMNFVYSSLLSREAVLLGEQLLKF